MSKNIIVILLVIIGAMPVHAQQFNTAPWLDDFHQLLAEMSSHYANLEWAANERRMDLPQLKTRTEERLRQSTSDQEARTAIERFLKSFGDRHIEIQWQPRGKAPEQAAGGLFCDRMEYNDLDSNGGIDWSIVPEFVRITDADSADFPAGLLRIGKRTLGVVRIGLFSEHAHPALCRQAQKDLGKADDGQCTGQCEDDFEAAVGNLLTAAMERRVRGLRAAGADTILVDITGNGGGTSWVESAARVLTPISLKSPRSGLVKHEHSMRELEDRLHEVEADLKNTTAAAERPQLEETIAALRSAVNEASKPCDRSVLWSGPPSTLHCSQIVLVPPRTLAEAARYKYHVGANLLPVIVLIDGNTGSSAEYFAAMLQDNDAATFIGQLTAGAGCGFTDGGIPVRLRNSGANVRLPDCVRYRADGSDEVAGIIPNVVLPWADRDSHYQQAAKLKRWLEAGMPGMPTASLGK